jgi:transposase
LVQEKEIKEKEPPMKKESMKLTPAQRQSLAQILSKGKALAWTLKHAQVLLKVDRGPQGPGWSTSHIVAAYDVSRSTVERICRLFREQGLDAALFRRPQPPRPQKRTLDGEAEAHLVAVLCGQKPEEAERWSLRLVREKVVELEIVESISHETVRQG